MAEFLNIIHHFQYSLKTAPTLSIVLVLILLSTAVLLLAYSARSLFLGWCTPIGLFPVLMIALILNTFSESHSKDCNVPDYTDNSPKEERKKSYMIAYERETDPVFFWGALAINWITAIIVAVIAIFVVKI